LQAGISRHLKEAGGPFGVGPTDGPLSDH